MEPDTFKPCSTCKRPIPFGTVYYRCNVSTCNRKSTDFAFCSVACWDAHVPVYRHRDAWAEEETAPSAGEAAAAAHRTAEQARARAERATSRVEPTPIVEAATVPKDTLVVASKLKAYVRARSGMNTSDGVMRVLSDKLREHCDAAIARAAEAGRKTVLDRDF